MHGFVFFFPSKLNFYIDQYLEFTGCLEGLTMECQSEFDAVDECIISDPDSDCMDGKMCVTGSFNENNQVISSDFLNCLGELTHPTVVDAKACMDYFCGKKTFFFI